MSAVEREGQQEDDPIVDAIIGVLPLLPGSNHLTSLGVALIADALTPLIATERAAAVDEAMGRVREVEQIATVNGALYRSAEDDVTRERVFLSQLATGIEAACNHDPDPVKFDVCVACADAARQIRTAAPGMGSEIPIINDGDEHVAGLRTPVARALPLAPSTTHEDGATG